ncbi:MAG: hypothetical protein HY302_13260 [Opitutae bacterium]|nr:hypothetical protein [Opitutae bacterium]
MHALGDLGGRRGLQQQSHCLGQVGARFLDRAPLAGDFDLGAVRDKPVAFALDDRGELAGGLHVCTVFFARVAASPAKERGGG